MTASVSTLGVAVAQHAGGRALGLAGRLATLTRRSAASIRSVVLQTLGLAAIDYAMFQWTSIAGFVAIGVSFFALDYITGGAPAEAEDGDQDGGSVPRN
jgi:membrane protein DedA with SNARE-associated domain